MPGVLYLVNIKFKSIHRYYVYQLMGVFCYRLKFCSKAAPNCGTGKYCEQEFSFLLILFWLILLICINLKAKRPFDVLPCGTRKSKSPCRPQWDKFCWRIGWFLDDFSLLRSCFFTFYPFLNNRSRLNRIITASVKEKKGIERMVSQCVLMQTSW